MNWYKHTFAFNVCAHGHNPLQNHTYSHAHTQIHTHTHITHTTQIQKHTHTHSRTHTHTHNIHTYTHYIHTHTLHTHIHARNRTYTQNTRTLLSIHTCLPTQEKEVKASPLGTQTGVMVPVPCPEFPNPPQPCVVLEERLDMFLTWGF